jgi:hypothetical protein
MKEREMITPQVEEMYVVIFTGLCVKHTEYIIGGIETVNDYVMSYEIAYGVKAGVIRACKSYPAKLKYDESVFHI